MTPNQKKDPVVIGAEFWRDVYRISRQAELDHTLSVRELLVKVGEKHGIDHDELIRRGIIEAPKGHPLSREARAPGGQAKNKRADQ